MRRKVLPIILTLMLVLISVLATTATAAASDTTDREDAAIAAADRIISLQSADGGFPWIVTDPPGDSASNCLGVTAWGVLKAYEIQAKPEYEASLAKAYKYVELTTPTYVWGTDPYTGETKYYESPKGVDSYPDFTFLVWLADAAEDSPTLLAAIQIEVPGATPESIRAAAKTRWDTRTLYLGSTQELDPNGSATNLAEYIRDVRHGQDYDALIPWDLELGVEAALALDGAFPGQGYAAQAADITGVIYGAIDDTEGEGGTCLYFDSEDTTQSCYVLGLTGAIKADAETGLYYQAKSSTLLPLLRGEQLENGQWVCDIAEGDAQATAYAIMALFVEGSEDAIDSANAGAVWLVTDQNEDGSWYADGDEYLEVNGEAARALVLAAGGTTTDIEVNIPQIVAISVTPTSINFGTIYPGQSSADKAINVDNIGTVEIKVDATLVTTGTVFDNLSLNGQVLYPLPTTTDLITNLVTGTDQTVIALLEIPGNYSAKGVETNQLVFEATEQ